MKGGPRVGTGPKVIGMIEPQTVDMFALDDGTHPLLEPPEDISESAKGAWRVYARFAIEQVTLTDATVAGFRQFCQQWAYLAELDAEIQKMGAGTKEAAAHMRLYLNLAQRLDSSMARFKLTACGKPAVQPKPKAAANPWAKVAVK